GVQRWFLTEIRTAAGITAATISYTAPKDAQGNTLSGCSPAGLTGSAAGTPYISSIVSSEGRTLKFYYSAYPSTCYPTQQGYGGSDCVITSIAVKDSQTSAETIVA